MRTEPDFSKGLVPAIAQDAETGEVLMVAYQSPEAWERTRETGRAWFQSRTRGLWEKGATSGNYLDVVEIRLDCDQDAVLLRVNPRGPACHTGERSCFFQEVPAAAASADGPVATHLRTLEDFHPGDRFHFGPVRVTRESIVEFATRWDPQRFHLSEEGGRDSIFGRMIASGSQTLAEVLRLYSSGLLRESACQGSPGMEQVRFVRPVFPGDELSVELTVTRVAEHPRRPERGSIDVDVVASNQAGEPVLTLRATILMGRRGHPAGAPKSIAGPESACV